MSRRFARGCMGIVAAGCILVADGSVASAGESLASFFADQFGIGRQEPSYATPVWADPDGEDRPLVVRPHRRRTPRVSLGSNIVKGPIKPVSIYEDKTLRRGDAVMTAQGIRIFTGGESLPYRDSDFVAVSDADGLSKTVTKALSAIDRIPRS